MHWFKVCKETLHVLELYNVTGGLLVLAFCPMILDAFFMSLCSFLTAVEALIFIDMLTLQHE